MHDWKQSGHHFGIQLQRNVQALTDLRFADDILMFALSLQQILEMLRSLVVYLRQVGFVLDASKTKLMTTQAQPPDRVWFQADSYIDVVHGSSSHKWLGCQLSMDGDHTADVEFHLHAAARAFWANKLILRDRHVPLSLRANFFEAVVTPVACFGAGHRKISIPHLRKLDSEWRRLLRSMVGPPSGLDWSLVQGIVKYPSLIYASWIQSGDDCLEAWQRRVAHNVWLADMNLPAAHSMLLPGVSVTALTPNWPCPTMLRLAAGSALRQSGSSASWHGIVPPPFCRDHHLGGAMVRPVCNRRTTSLRCFLVRVAPGSRSQRPGPCPALPCPALAALWPCGLAALLP
eukprot:s837_g6.t1